MSRALTGYKIVACSPWLHLVLFWSLVAHVCVVLGHLPAYGEPRAAVGLGLRVHFLLAGLTLQPLLIAPLLFLPVAGLCWAGLMGSEKRAFAVHTASFALGFSVFFLHAACDPWSLFEWFMD